MGPWEVFLLFLLPLGLSVWYIVLRRNQRPELPGGRPEVLGRDWRVDVGLPRKSDEPEPAVLTRPASLYVAFAAAGLLLLGALGPWAKVFAISVGGLDGSNDGWLVLVAALVAGVGLAARASTGNRGVVILPFLAGLAAAGVAWYDRDHIAANAGDAAQVVSVGWGLNLSLAAGIVLALASAQLARPRRA